MSAPIRILTISNYRPTIPARPEAAAMIGLQQAGAEVTIMTYGDAEWVPEFEKVGIRVIDFHPEKKWDRKAIRLIREELKRGKYDILHLFNSKAAVNGIQAAWSLPVKVVLYRGFTGHIHWYDPSLYFKYFSPRVDGIWCIAEAINELFSGQPTMPAHKVFTINKGHHIHWYENVQPLDLKAVFDLPEDAFVLNCTANVRPMKGMPYLAEMVNRIPPDLPIYHLWVGKGMDDVDLLRTVSRGPNRDKLILPGYRKDALNITAGADAFVLGSLYGEAITKAVIEAMSLARPCIITRIPGNRNLLVHEESGLFVPPRDPAAMAEAVQRLYHHPELRQKYGETARERIRTRFSVERTVEGLLDMYRTLLER